MTDHDIVKVKDIMTKNVVALKPGDGLDKATKLFEDPNHDGFPVVNEDGVLIGLVTAYDMVSQSYAIHLPSLLHILDNASGDEPDGENLKKQFEKVASIKVRDMMNQDPLIVGPEVRVEDLAKEFIQHHRVNPIPVVDADKKLLGIVSRVDIIKFFDERFLNKILQESGHDGILKRLARLEDK